MMFNIKEAQPAGDFVIWLRFADGREGEVDLRNELGGPIFEPRSDPAYFRKFTVHPELRTLVWPNGADLAQESLDDKARLARR